MKRQGKEFGPAQAARHSAWPVRLALGATLIAAAVISATPARAQDWSGAYAGMAVGYAGGDDESQEINGPRAYFADLDGAASAARFGWQKQTGRLVAGLEAEAGYLGIEGDATHEATGGTVTTGAELGAYGVFAAKLGYVPSADWMLFGRVGLVLAEIDGRTDQVCNGPDLCGGAQSTPVSSARTEDVSLGLLLGVGFEKQLGGRWTGRIDYQYMTFREELALPSIDGPGWDHEVDVHAVTFGLSYRF